jgi:hypothetical protein
MYIQIILETSIGDALSYPELVHKFKPHATALFMSHPQMLYAANNNVSEGLRTSRKVDAVLRLTEKLFTRRDILFNTTV